MRSLSLLLTSFGFLLSVVVYLMHGPNTGSEEAIHIFLFTCVIPVLIAHRKFRIGYSEIYQGCGVWGFLVNLALLGAGLLADSPTATGGFIPAQLAPAFFWMLMCGVYSAPTRNNGIGMTRAN